MIQAKATSTKLRYKVGKLNNNIVILAKMLPSGTEVFYWHTCVPEKRFQIDFKEKCYCHYYNQGSWSFYYVLGQAEGYPPRHG